MEYRSPLGYNFKFEQSLSASKEEKLKETPRKDERFSFDNSGRRMKDSDSRRNSGGRNSPSWQRHNSSNWKSPMCKHSRSNESVSIEQYYHPSMLENPWEELQRN